MTLTDRVLSEAAPPSGLDRLAAWLRNALGEDLPEGIAGEVVQALEGAEGSATPGRDGPEGFDAFRLESALLRLTEETRLQGRAFRALEEQVRSLQGVTEGLDQERSEARAEGKRLGRALEVLETARRQQLADAKREGQLELLRILLDARDRLQRGLDAARRFTGPTSKPGHRSGKISLRQLIFSGANPLKEALDGLSALREGYRLSQARIDESLERLEVQEVPAEGLPFDPHHMTAAEVRDVDDEALDGLVLEVYRSGYLWQQEVLQPAEVVVGRLRTETCEDSEEHYGPAQE